MRSEMIQTLRKNQRAIFISALTLLVGFTSYADDKCYQSVPTFYNPKKGGIEGGSKTRFSTSKSPEKVRTVQQAIKDGGAVTIAMDSTGAFSKKCNQREKRCLVLVKASGFDKAFPDYRSKFPNVPANSFLAVIEDTGSAFKGKGTGRMDIASEGSSKVTGKNGKSKNINHWDANPSGFSSLSFQVVGEKNSSDRSKPLTDWMPPSDVSDFAQCKGGYFDRQSSSGKSGNGGSSGRSGSSKKSSGSYSANSSSYRSGKRKKVSRSSYRSASAYDYSTLRASNYDQ